MKQQRREELHRDEGWSGRFQSPVLWIVLAAIVVLVLGSLVLPAIRKLESPRVVVYTSQDKVYAEEIFKRFTAETGVEVRAVYDSEAVKTVGIANRLLAERRNPQCDVFWNNEELRTRQLAAEGVFDAETGWTAFGYRSRRVVINTNLVSFDEAPRRFSDLTNDVWRGRFAMAYPLFGTTATHLMALRSTLPADDWRNWRDAVSANQPMIVDGNSVVVQQVGRGEVAVGMTDFDDIAAGQREGYPVASLPMASDALLIPNTVALVRNGSNPEAGRRFIRWLIRPETVGRLVEMKAIEGIDLEAEAPGTLQPNWPVMLQSLEEATTDLERVFAR